MSGSWGAQLVGGPINAAGQNPGGVATGPQIDCPGGLMVIAAVANNWNGATATLEILGPDGATLLPVSPTQSTFTANGLGTVYLPPCTIQMVVTGGPPTALYVSISRVVA
jgi:hypothetical protein